MKRKVGILIALFMLVLLIVPFSRTSANVTGRFVPPNGQLLIIGQDIDSIDAYVGNTNVTPGGVTGYSSLSRLEGITSVDDGGAGRNHLNYLANQYPDSTIALGMWLVDQLGGINNGTYDSNMNTLIDILVGYDRPVFLRWGYEFDGSWNHYDPNQYRDAWIRMYNLIQSRGAQDNIVMVWQGASYCGGTYNGNPISAWYPGDQYVDWVGLSYFAPQDCNWDRVNEITQFARDRNKPILIAESASQRYDIEQLTYSPCVSPPCSNSQSAQQIWDDWFARYFQFINDNSDVIKAVAYINADWDSQSRWGPPYGEGYWGDTRIQVNSLIRTNWLNEVTSSGWHNASSTLFCDLGYDDNCGPPPPTVTPGGPTATATTQPPATETPTQAPTSDPNAVFGIEYVNDNTLRIFHVDQGWTGGWNYICLNGGCYPGTLTNGRYQRDFGNVTCGQTYNIEFKVQDNASGQYITSKDEVFNCGGGPTVTPIPPTATSVPPTATATGVPPTATSTPVNPPTATATTVPPTATATSQPSGCSGLGIAYVNDNTLAVYQEDQGWSGSWNYICLNGACYTGSLSNGFYQREFSGSLGQSYNIEAKIQDNASGQYIASGQDTFTAQSCQLP